MLAPVGYSTYLYSYTSPHWTSNLKTLGFGCSSSGIYCYDAHLALIPPTKPPIFSTLCLSTIIDNRQSKSSMRLNYETCIVGTKCVLVPYRPCHVAKYHKWMKDPHLLEMTGSEPLSLEEEIAMQLSWRDDDQKCTFIVLAKDLCELKNGKEWEDDDEFCQRNLDAMVGDVNLFFSEEEDDDDEDEEVPSSDPSPKNSQNSDPPQLQAELDIMVAEKSHQGKGIGKEASCLMMMYGAKVKQIRRFFCKIKESNDASLTLFQKSLGYKQCAYAACFQECELERKEETAEEMIKSIVTIVGDGFQWKQFHCPDDDKCSSS